MSFAERARTRRGQRDDVASGAGAAGGGSTGVGDSSDEPANLAREAMFRRFGQLMPAGSSPRVASPDDELAVLAYDSMTEPEPLVGVRGDTAGSTRQLTFRGPSLTLEVQLEGPARELTCQVVPPQAASLEVRHGSGSLELGADEFGTFYAASLPEGAVSLRCVPFDSDLAATATSWFSISDDPIG